MKLLRKIVSFLLCCLLVTQLIPFSALPVLYAASAVDVSEVLTPEFAILNASTGAGYNLYSNDQTKNAFDNYYNVNYGWANALGGRFYRNNDGLAMNSGSYASGDSQKFYDHNYLWNYAGTTIETLVNSGCLSIGAGATFHNNRHKHNKKYYYYCVMNMTLSEGSRQIRQVAGYHVTNLDGAPADKTYTETIDKGFGYYGKLYGDSYSSGTTVRLKMKQNEAANASNSKKPIDDCTSKSSVEKVSVYLYDGDKPTVKKVYLTGGSDNSNFKAGDTVQVHVVFSEPMRFADGSANHGDAYITLQLDGEASTDNKAYLTKLGSATLDGKTVSEAIYTWTIPSDCNKEKKIATVKLDQITDAKSSKYSLVHPYNIRANLSGVLDYAAKKTSLMTQYNQLKAYGVSEKNCAVYKEASNMIQDREGITYATSLFTDIAGNSVLFTDSNGKRTTTHQITNCYLDCKAPEVIGVSLDPNMHADEIEAYVNVQAGNMSQGTSGGVTASDMANADVYAGIGDSITFTVDFSEKLKWGNSTDYKSIQATTNVKDTATGEYVVLTASSSNAVKTIKPENTTNYGKGASEGYVTSITLDAFVPQSTYFCEDSEGKIKITGVSFGSNKNPMDASGNVFSGWTDKTGMADKQIQLDVTPATVTQTSAEAAVSGQNSYDGFFVPLKITDAGSGATAVPGKLMLTNHDKTSDAFRYKIAVRANAATSSSEIQWETTAKGDIKWYKSGEAVTFAQMPGDTYLYFGFDSGSEYNIKNFDLTVWPEDNAGNNGANTGSSAYPTTFTLTYTIDQVGPELSVAAASRNYNSQAGEGILTVPVTAVDPSGFDVNGTIVQYAWSDSNKTAPATWEDGQTTQTNETQATISVSHTVPDGTSWTQYLWLKATDVYGNETGPICLGGQYTYNLQPITYTASYSSDVTSSINNGGFYIKDLSSDGGAAVLYRTPEMKVTDGPDAGEYWFIDFTTRNDSSHNLLNTHNRLVSVTESNGIYTFTTASATVNNNYLDEWGGYFSGNYYGEAVVKVLSGNKNAFLPVSQSGDNVWAYWMTTAGTDGYPVSAAEYRLRMCGNAYPDKVFDISMEISGPEDYTNTYDNLTADDGYKELEAGKTLPKDLTAYTFTLNLTPLKQEHWGLDSMIFGSFGSTQFNPVFNVYCGAKKKSYPLEKLRVQNFRIPAEDTEELGSGFYLFSVELRLKNGNYQEIFLNGSGTSIPAIQVDNSSAAAATGFISYYTSLDRDAEGQHLDINVNKDAYEHAVSISPACNAATESEDGINGTILTLPLSTTYTSGNASIQATVAGSFSTSLFVQDDDYTYSSSACNGKTLVSGSRWIKITNTADGKTITKWILEDHFKGANGGTSLLILPCDSGAAMKAKEATYIDNKTSDNTLLMVRNKTNVLTLQFYNFNGQVSDQKIMVVQAVTDPVRGSISLENADDGSTASGGFADRILVRYTPQEGTDPTNLRVYGAFAGKQIEDTVRLDGGVWTRYLGSNNGSGDEEFLYDQASGSFIRILESDQGYHDGIAIIVENQATGYVSPQIVGSLFTYDSDYYYDVEGPHFDRTAPIIVTEYNTAGAPVYTSANPAAPSLTDNGDGTYKIQFTVCDNVVEEGGEMTVLLTPGEGYAQTIGMADTTAPAPFTFRFSQGNLIWEAGTDANEQGIFKAEASYYGSHGGYDDKRLATVTLHGAVPPGTVAEDIDVSFTIRVLDRFGKESQPVQVSNQVETQPLVVSSVSYTMTDIPYDSGDDHRYQTADHALNITFSQPVVAQSSWICKTPSGYGQLTKQDEFPITRDGDYNLTVVDIFGNLHAVPVTVDKIGTYGYEVDVTLSETELTGDPVTITVSNGYTTLYHYFPYVGSVGGGDMDPDNPNDFVRTVTENGAYHFYIMDDQQSYNDCYYAGMYLNAERITVYVDNIRTEAPDAAPVFYFGDTGKTYTPETLPNRTETGGVASYTQLVVGGYVSVSYTADEEIHPVNGSDSSLTYRSTDTNLAYSFAYADAFGHTKTLSGSLSDYGILISDNAGADTESPTFNAHVYGVINGNAGHTAAFTERDTQAYIAEQLSETGFVQSMLFVFSVRDASDVKLVLSDTQPQSLSYSAASGSIPGVSVSGLNMTIDKGYDGRTFYVNVVDNAAAQTGASADNFISVPVSVDASVLDNAKATAALQYQHKLYSADVYLTITDTNDKGENITLASGNTISPLTEGLEDVSAAGEVKFKYTIRQNGIVPLLLSDAAGNISTILVSTSAIDVTAPVVTVQWSPCARGANGLLPELPAEGPLNIPPVLQFNSSKPIESYEVYACAGTTKPAIDSSEWVHLANYTWFPAIEEITSDIDSITVRFSGYGAQDGVWVKGILTAPNGISGTCVTSFGSGVVDCTAPDMDLCVEALYQTGASEPYAYQFTATPDEAVYCAKGGTTVYTPDIPYVFTLRTSGSYRYVFTDMAGNPTTLTITVPETGQTASTYVCESRYYLGSEMRTDVISDAPLVDKYSGFVTLQCPDTAAPQLSFSPTIEELTAMSVVQSCNVSVTASEPCTITYSMPDGKDKVFTVTNPASDVLQVTFNKNGVMSVKAVDLTGNGMSAAFAVGNVDSKAPDITILRSTVPIRQDSDAAALKTLLDAGVSATDERDGVTTSVAVAYDASGVDLTKVGVYKVPYSATDDAGNIAEVIRYVKVYSKTQPGILVDGELATPDESMTLKEGEHTLTVTNLAKLESGEDEPYTMYVKGGLLRSGQMKYGLGSVKMKGDTVTLTKGYYTVYVITQSRESFRITLYVER